MEYTLHQLIEKKKAFAPERAIDLSIQLLLALGAAHKDGNAYGALYPDQIRFLEDGKVQILDLAAPRDPEDITLVYLSFVPPELLESDPASRPQPAPEADLYSAGIVLYTLLAGHTPFSGEDRDKVIEAILQIRMDNLPEMKGPLSHLNWILRKCLLRIPNRRFRTADEMINELRQIRPAQSQRKAAAAAAGDSPFPQSKKGRPKVDLDPKAIWEQHWKMIVPAAAGVVILLIVVILLAGHKGPTGSVVRGQPRPLPAEWPNETSPALSPDGTQIAYLSDFSGNNELHVRPVDGAKGIALTRSPGKEDDPRWSPLGDSILYTYREPVKPPALFSVSPAGGIPEKIVGEAEQGSWSQDGKKICFVILASNGTRSLAILDIETLDIKKVLEDVKGLANPYFSADAGEIVYDADSDHGHALFVVEVQSGKPKALTEGPNDSMPAWDWKADAIYYCSQRGENSEIWALDHKREKKQITSGEKDYRPDVNGGKKGLSFYRLDWLSDILVFDLSKKISRKVSPIPGASTYPLSVAAGRWLAFLEKGQDGLSLNWISWNNSVTTNILKSVPLGSNFSVSPDGSNLFWEQPSGGLQQIVLPSGDSTILGQSLLLPYVVSPDRKSLFYTKKEGNEAVFLLKNLKDQQEETLFRLPLAGRVVRASWTTQSKSILLLTADHQLSLFSLATRQKTPLLSSCFDFALRPKSSTAAVLTGMDLKHAQLILLEVEKGKQTQLVSFDPEQYAVHIDWSQSGDLIYYDRIRPAAKIILIN